MKLSITSQAASHLQDELDLQSGDFVRFHVKYGGHSTIQTSFSLGISTEEPTKVGASSNVNGIEYYIEDSDLWYFETHNLEVDYNAATEEIEYHYEAVKS
ncbi:HesB/YadR/YfhF family protein [Marinicrinis sediminis]|uniref:HesB/YadR/YfhF family protein n=1 Tax=Marinicrinis sediminis TaxID=1652465 RepID=A0ABW5REU6_9BACL